MFIFFTGHLGKIKPQVIAGDPSLHAGVNTTASSFGRSFPRVTRDEPSQIVSHGNEDNKAVMQ